MGGKKRINNDLVCEATARGTSISNAGTVTNEQRGSKSVGGLGVHSDLTAD